MPPFHFLYLAAIIAPKSLFVLVIVVDVVFFLFFCFFFSENYILSQDVTPPGISIREGESASFVCKVSGSGIRSIEWYKDKLKVPDRYVVYNNTKDHKISTIQLPAVTVAQGGMYECRTTVKAGRTKLEGYKAQSAMLLVTGSSSYYIKSVT